MTGGGWINSPAGAYAPNPALTGKANFGFVSKYQKGANVPTGNTEFQFKEGNLNFSEHELPMARDSAAPRAQFKGTGTINGAGNYNFMVTAVDGDAVNGTKKPDSFRIKITQGHQRSCTTTRCARRKRRRPTSDHPRRWQHRDPDK